MTTNNDNLAWVEYLPPDLIKTSHKLCRMRQSNNYPRRKPATGKGSVLVDVFHKYKHPDKDKLHALLLSYGGCEFKVVPSVSSSGITKRFTTELQSAISNPEHFFSLFPRLPSRLYFPCSYDKEERDRAKHSKV